jgi:hypothetical protein
MSELKQMMTAMMTKREEMKMTSKIQMKMLERMTQIYNSKMTLMILILRMKMY